MAKEEKEEKCPCCESPKVGRRFACGFISKAEGRPERCYAAQIALLQKKLEEKPQEPQSVVRYAVSPDCPGIWMRQGCYYEIRTMEAATVFKPGAGAWFYICPVPDMEKVWQPAQEVKIKLKSNKLAPALRAIRAKKGGYHVLDLDGSIAFFCGSDSYEEIPELHQEA